MSNSSQMSVKERIFHSALFEMGAVLISTLIVLAFASVETDSAFGLSMLISLIAMVWNFLFNLGFDRIFTAPRETRGLPIRLLHTAMFEGGLLIFTIPLLAYMLSLSFWQALIADVGLTLVIMLYTLIFNWVYDNVRLKFIKPHA